MAKKRRGSKATKPLVVQKPASIADTINNEIIAAAFSAANQPVLIKVCRLCETKDGPFLNIFDADKVTAKKIDDLMPFVVAENDDLPHKICFRCSAKLEELHEFVQKCIKTQESLRKAIGKKGALATKTKTRKIWEEKLNESNISNDDLCDALIKKAMESIKDIPVVPAPVEETKPQPQDVPKKDEKKTVEPIKEEDNDIPLKELKLTLNKCDQKSTRSSRLNNSQPQPEEIEPVTLRKAGKKPIQSDSNEKSQNKVKTVSTPVQDVKSNNAINIKEDSDDSSKSVKKNECTEEVNNIDPSKKTFDIMDHISMIKVNGVGVLFQCKLCNRNFLKKEVVTSHNCAKNGVPKVDFTKNIIPPEPPKPPTVKYIKTNIDNEVVKPSVVEKKLKPKAGPASKVKHDTVDLNPKVGTVVTPREPTPPPKPILPPPSVHFASPPSIRGRFRLLPGPNNSFTLVEDQASDDCVEVPVTGLTKTPTSVPTPTQVPATTPAPLEKPREKAKPKSRKQNAAVQKNKTEVPSNDEVIDLDDQPDSAPPVAVQQPYPVGLFQTAHPGVFTPPVPAEPVAFTTPAMKKQSYTIVQTGNPSKLLISTKPQAPVEEPPKKRQKKSKIEPKVKSTEPKQPFSVTLEDAAPPTNTGFFTFINVDPLLQPSYVLPTDNIIQESQITTSTPIVQNAASSKDKEKEKEKEKDKYTCNMCGEKFSREKKLLTHIQSHYNKLDEEDQLRSNRNTRKRGRKTD